MVIERVPRLNIRPKHLIKVYSSNIDQAIPLFRNEDNAAIQKIVENYLSNCQLVGTIQKLSITSERDVNFYRTLDYSNLGKIRETYPSLPDHTATASVIAFYTKHLLNVFKATSQGDVFMTSASSDDSIIPTFNIYNQIAPLIIKVELLEPDNTDPSKDSTTTLILWDCWFRNSEIEFDVTTADLAIIQESEIKFAYPIVL